jgi:hypothetical protein
VGKACQSNAARRHQALTHRPPFGSSMPGEIRNSSWPGSSRPSTSFNSPTARRGCPAQGRA